ncbi:MAG TPA: bacterioferritin [Syntrophothermus lipocalidus]|nr:bacterioferritin [Syntrophothermus lipocalidus]
MVIRIEYATATEGFGSRQDHENVETQKHKPRWCAEHLPYPPVMVENPNPFYATLLMEDHAGRISEMSAITQYLYHHHLLNEHYPDLASLLECIALVEMTHMEMLAEAIIRLGGKPKFGAPCNQTISWWKGDRIYYGCGICDMLAADIQGEKDAISQYHRHLDAIDDKYVRAILARIIKDEKEHIRLLTEKFNKYCCKNKNK